MDKKLVSYDFEMDNFVGIKGCTTRMVRISGILLLMGLTTTGTLVTVVEFGFCGPMAGVLCAP